MNHDMLAAERLKSRLKAIDQRVRLDRIKIIDQEANLFQRSMKQEAAKLIREESKDMQLIISVYLIENFNVGQVKFYRGENIIKRFICGPKRNIYWKNKT